MAEELKMVGDTIFYGEGIIMGNTLLSATLDTSVIRGKQGIQGEQGVPGKDGKDFTYADFTQEQLEALRGEPGADGKDGSRIWYAPGGIMVQTDSNNSFVIYSIDTSEVDNPDQEEIKVGHFLICISNLYKIKTISGTTLGLDLLCNLKGNKGDPGKDGINGVDGKTPIKGTDYWTAADKQTIVNDVISSLGYAEEGSY